MKYEKLRQALWILVSVVLLRGIVQFPLVAGVQPVDYSSQIKVDRFYQKRIDTEKFTNNWELSRKRVFEWMNPFFTNIPIVVYKLTTTTDYSDRFAARYSFNREVFSQEFKGEKGERPDEKNILSGLETITTWAGSQKHSEKTTVLKLSGEGATSPMDEPAADFGDGLASDRQGAGSDADRSVLTCRYRIHNPTRERLTVTWTAKPTQEGPAISQGTTTLEPRSVTFEEFPRKNKESKEPRYGKYYQLSFTAKKAPAASSSPKPSGSPSAKKPTSKPIPKKKK